MKTTTKKKELLPFIPIRLQGCAVERDGMWRARHDKKTNQIFPLQLYLCVARLLGSPPLRRRLPDKLISNPGGISLNTFYLSSCSARRQRPRYNTFLPYVRLSPPPAPYARLSPPTHPPYVRQSPFHFNTSVCHPPTHHTSV